MEAPMEATLTRQSLYDWMGLSPDADSAQIQAVYLRLAGQWHPARLGLSNQAARERFYLLANAYATLSDPAERARYHEYLQGQGDEPFAMASPSPDPFALYLELIKQQAATLHAQQRSPDAIRHLLLGEGCPEPIVQAAVRGVFGQNAGPAEPQDGKKKSSVGMVVAVTAGVIFVGIAAIGMVAAIAIPQYVEKQKEKAFVAGRAEAAKAVEELGKYIAENDRYPASLEEVGYTPGFDDEDADNKIESVVYDPAEGVVTVTFKGLNQLDDTPLIAYQAMGDGRLCLKMEGRTFKPEETCPADTASALQNPMADPASEANAEDQPPEDDSTAESDQGTQSDQGGQPDSAGSSDAAPAESGAPARD